MYRSALANLEPELPKGTWLDIGCANGLLMETLAAWVADNGYRVEPYGLERQGRALG